MSNKPKRQFNEDLNFVQPNYNGNLLDKDGLFVNLNFPFEPKFKELIKWQKERKAIQKEKKQKIYKPIVKDGNDFFTKNKDAILWLGHASFLIRLAGKVFIIDPILFSPSFLMKRQAALPIATEALVNIDYLLISHDHRDHVDKKSLQLIYKQNPNIKVATALNMKPLLNEFLPKAPIQEAGWYQQYTIVDDVVKLYFLPTRHWGRRNLTDTNKRLWGAFLLRTATHTVYFGGDSGYDAHFKEVNELFGKIDYALLGIGAYKPEWFMQSSHTSPEKALQAAQDLQCSQMMPMHYGTFDLSDEFMDEALQVCQKLYAVGNYNFNLLDAPIGNTIWL
jgi:L-ascorbate metabolism protein UlaG (beta-lactamase superfamily)